MAQIRNQTLTNQLHKLLKNLSKDPQNLQLFIQDLETTQTMQQLNHLIYEWNQTLQFEQNEPETVNRILERSYKTKHSNLHKNSE